MLLVDEHRARTVFRDQALRFAAFTLPDKARNPACITILKSRTKRIDWARIERRTSNADHIGTQSATGARALSGAYRLLKADMACCHATPWARKQLEAGLPFSAALTLVQHHFTIA